MSFYERVFLIHENPVFGDLLIRYFLDGSKLFRQGSSQLNMEEGELPRAKARGLWTQSTLFPSGKSSTA